MVRAVPATTAETDMADGPVNGEIPLPWRAVPETTYLQLGHPPMPRDRGRVRHVEEKELRFHYRLKHLMPLELDETIKEKRRPGRDVAQRHLLLA